jgi:hypothetical protein
VQQSNGADGGLISLRRRLNHHRTGCRWWQRYRTVGLLRGRRNRRRLVQPIPALHWYAGYRERVTRLLDAPWLADYPGFYPLPGGVGSLPGAAGALTAGTAGS